MIHYPRSPHPFVLFTWIECFELWIEHENYDGITVSTEAVEECIEMELGGAECSLWAYGLR